MKIPKKSGKTNKLHQILCAHILKKLLDYLRLFATRYRLSQRLFAGKLIET